MIERDEKWVEGVGFHLSRPGRTRKPLLTPADFGLV